MRVAVTGATGLIGGRVVRALAGHGHTVRVLSRREAPSLPSGVESAAWNPLGGQASEAALEGVDAVVHLAGENVAQSWTPAAKRSILESRVEGTRALVAAVSRLPKPPAALISASAVGYYGSRGDEILTESSTPGEDFLAGVCAVWEREAAAAEQFGVRVARLRIGVALDRHGGALARMLPPFRFGLGGRLGDRRQWMSWIHVKDLAELFCFAVENPVSGAVNAVAPIRHGTANSRGRWRGPTQARRLSGPRVRVAYDIRRDVRRVAFEPTSGSQGGG